MEESASSQAYSPADCEEVSPKMFPAWVWERGRVTASASVKTDRACNCDSVSSPSKNEDMVGS